MDADPTWSLCSALAADARWLAELRAVVLRPDLERLGRFDEQRVRSRFLDGYRPERTRIVLVDGRPRGCIASRVESDAVWIEHFYLAPDAQGRGIGGAVFTGVLHEEARHALPFRIDVLKGSAARRLYERHGFAWERAEEWDDLLVAPAR